MSSINHHPTFHYSQPDEYHFSHDSVFLARHVFEYLQSRQLQPRSALDLCAGCGVIGLDLIFHLEKENRNTFEHFDFLEIQQQYEKHFDENLIRLGKTATTCRFVNGNYGDLKVENSALKYDLILSNPPYFFNEQGKRPSSDLKWRSRFFVDSDLATLFEFIYRNLSTTGIAFILIRDQSDHNQDQLEVIRKLCDTKLRLTLSGDIRGTQLVTLQLI